jgi:transcriptional regulator with XRE-family HTH domain
MKKKGEILTKFRDNINVLLEYIPATKLAEIADCDRTTIAKYSSGDREPSLKMVTGLCKAFDVSYDDLMENDVVFRLASKSTDDTIRFLENQIERKEHMYKQAQDDANTLFTIMIELETFLREKGDFETLGKINELKHKFNI